ncbi:hypothetical protein N0V88_004532 [Collariella sp. IMI 366227]|nr:hypothetical protein N0V88_004532 [Collariella sp. IMI 366227]
MATSTLSLALASPTEGPVKESTTQPTITIVTGYRPGILARTLEMHMDFYWPTEKWGLEFETGIAKGMANLLSHIDKPGNQVWSAITTTPAADPEAPPVERIVGVVYVNADYYGKDDMARLQFFIVDESARGMGVGKKLFAAAMEFLKKSGIRECHLVTLRKLTAARRLYEGAGFVAGEERSFGKPEDGMKELPYVWHRPDGE